MITFGGAKLAILSRGCVVTILRDDRPGIPYPGFWDLPGGGREGIESPEECVLRETQEELSLVVQKSSLNWKRSYPTKLSGADCNWFFAADLPYLDTQTIHLGDEGQEWRMMQVEGFLGHAKATPHLKQGLVDFLSSLRE